jgi:hypothetical protein
MSHSIHKALEPVSQRVKERPYFTKNYTMVIICLQQLITGNVIRKYKLWLFPYKNTTKQYIYYIHNKDANA